ncbi:MAG: CxxC motif-containing protein (DUF1111 family) [Bacteroidia bacterium]|jgi:CxxC motif-containing protein (DUF1111 family)
MIQLKYKAILGIFVFVVMLGACETFEPKAPAENELLDGPIEGLSFEQSKQFLDGDIAFNDDVFVRETGLGPTFVATSCGSCHAGDGKGHPFTTLTRFGQSAPGVNTFLDLGGPQLQNRALPGYQPERLPDGATFSKITPPANTGLGYLEAVTDADIIQMADPNDLNNDGISGVPQWKQLAPFIAPSKNAVERNGQYIHRFGKKAAAYNLLHQTVAAYSEDMGITSDFIPVSVYSGLATDPEVSLRVINDVVFYLQTLKAPIPRNIESKNVIEGKNIFVQLNCSGCHKPVLKTGFSPIEVLSNKEFYPYTDLLLHDMGSELDDQYTEGNAETYEWRTPPLWGLGLSPDSQGGQYYLMHDGRATSIESAIVMHGGEAKNSRDQYEGLSEADKLKLLEFLKSL